MALREIALFAGAGGGILGSHLLGWRTVAAVEIEEYPRAVLLQRQLDGILPRFPIWDDIKTFNGKPFRGKIDIVTGGFPCQDISSAGQGKGLAGERSGLWTEMARVIGEVKPRYAFVENSPMLTSRGLNVVLMDLAEMGYDAQWGVLGADDAGAPHRRKRIWILADSDVSRQSDKKTSENKQVLLADSDKEGLEGELFKGCSDQERREEQGLGSPATGSGQNRRPLWWETDPADDETLEPGLGRVANGVANRMDRLKAIGNGQCPAVVRIAFKYLQGFPDEYPEELEVIEPTKRPEIETMGLF